MRKDKIILTDCDGVVLDWEEGFSVWMEHHGHNTVEGYQYMYNIGDRYGVSKEQGSQMVKVFNESAAIGFLPPLRDAQYFVKKLHEQHQYKFIAITSLSLDPYAKELRERNLNKLFGDAFIDVVCLDTGADKDEILVEYGAKYPGNYWIEDKPENLNAGIDVGLNGILIEHGHNMDYTGNANIVKNWNEIYNLITGE
jgi:FMN phosphatase YigB (HAD superfamily)|tara:strand:+ start:67 stop:657 length:591 start_codon:yes stop_codon:yes gene_type:complete